MYDGGWSVIVFGSGLVDVRGVRNRDEKLEVMRCVERDGFNCL